MPQAIYWLDRLGCADEVLAATKGCIKACELFVDGERLLTGRFPDRTIYPDFAILIVRRRFDEIMLDDFFFNHACSFAGYVNRTQIKDPSEFPASAPEIENIPCALHIHGPQLGQRRGESCMRCRMNDHGNVF